MDKLFYTIFSLMERQGPGDASSTGKAFSNLDLPQEPKILDVGCGTGSQTFVLSKLSNANIIAVDNYLPFLQTLIKNKTEHNITGGIVPVASDMKALPFRENTFDLIWSEGAAYIMGFENALRTWLFYLKSSAYVVVTELTWFQREVPAEIEEYFSEEYPDIRYYEDNLEMMESCGYKIVTFFKLPEDSWLKDFYTSAERVINQLRFIHIDDHSEKIFSMFEQEISIYRKYSAYFGYTFYILRWIA